MEASVVRSRWSLRDSRDIKDAWLLLGRRQHNHNALAIQAIDLCVLLLLCCAAAGGFYCFKMGRISVHDIKVAGQNHRPCTIDVTQVLISTHMCVIAMIKHSGQLFRTLQ